MPPKMVKMSWLRSLSVEEARPFLINKYAKGLCDEHAGFALVIDGLISFSDRIIKHLGNYFDDVKSLKKQQNLLDVLISTKRYGFDCWFDGEYKVIRDENNVLQIVMSTYQEDMSDLEVNALLLFSLVDEFSFLANRFPDDISVRSFLRYAQYTFHKVRLDFDRSLVSPHIANNRAAHLPSGYFFTSGDLAILADMTDSSVEEEATLKVMVHDNELKSIVAERFNAEPPEMKSFYMGRNFREAKKYIQRLQAHIWLIERKDYTPTKFKITVNGIDMSEKIQTKQNYLSVMTSSFNRNSKIASFFQKTIGQTPSQVNTESENISLLLALIFSDLLHGSRNDDPFYFLSKSLLDDKTNP